MPEVSAIGDPHIMSVWGCGFEADKNMTEAVLMKCKDDELRVRYGAEYGYRIYQVFTTIGGRHDRYHRETLKHGQTKEICGNTVEFHRYHAGINVRVTHLRNVHISGLFNRSNCL